MVFLIKAIMRANKPPSIVAGASGEDLKAAVDEPHKMEKEPVPMPMDNKR